MTVFRMISSGCMLVFLFLQNSCSTVIHSARTRSQQEHYLKRYGYLPTSSDSVQLASIQVESSPDAFAAALRRFQQMAGIAVTGTMTAGTIRMMELPRCGVPDNIETRRKRYAIEGSKWSKHKLSYKFRNYTRDMIGSKVASEIAKAFQFWSNASALRFQRNYYFPADIDIMFATGRHAADNFPFDGQGGTLAHAFFPQFGGDIHFDDDELWTSDSMSGINLLEVAVHEIGHSLGLHHSNVPDSIMNPYYNGYRQNIFLHSDDIEAIRSLYGPNN